MILQRSYIILGIFAIFPGIISDRVNVTKVSNCEMDDIILPVELFNISYYKKNDNFIDTIHGYYIIRNNDLSNRDVVVKFYKCATKSNASCSNNVEEHTYSFTCEHYLKDIGPWSLLSDSVQGDHCTHPLGVYELRHSTFNPIILKGYVEMDPKYKHYRFFLEFISRRDATSKDTPAEEFQAIRACINVEFDMYFE